VSQIVSQKYVALPSCLCDDRIMNSTTGATAVPALIRQFREELDLTQAELARRVGTTQSVISRLENDEYEGHSLSMLYRIAAAVNRRIAVTVLDGASSIDSPEGLSAAELDRLAQHLAQQFGAAGLSRSVIDGAVGLARAGAAARSVGDLRGAIEVGRGDVVADLRSARLERGREPAPS